MYKSHTQIIPTILFLRLFAFYFCSLNVIRQDELFEAIQSPQMFQKTRMPPKIRIIPRPGESRISGEVSIQFWLKSVLDLDTANPIIRVFFNKSSDSFFDLTGFYETEDEFTYTPVSNQFIQERRSPTSFKEWSRISINFEITYPSPTEMSLSIRNYLDGVGGFAFDHVFSGTNYWEVSRMETIIGEQKITRIGIEQ